MAKSKSSTKVNARRKVAKSAKRRTQVKAGVSTSEKPPAAAAESRAPGTKHERVLELLQRKEGASLAELVAETGWLPHTTRAALTRLRQSGHELQKEKRETGETAYRITAPRVARSRKAS
jgi:Protein of unknown function (DUF3489)